MDFNNKRVEDLTKVFDKRYSANNGNYEKVSQAKKDFNYRMFGIRDKEDKRQELREANSPQGQVNRLNERIGNAKSINNINRMNNIRGRFDK